MNNNINKEGYKMFLLDDFSNIPEQNKQDIRRSYLVSELKWLIFKLYSKRQRDILLYYFYEGYTQYQIADILGINRATINTHIKRGKCILKITIENEIDKLFKTEYSKII